MADAAGCTDTEGLGAPEAGCTAQEGSEAYMAQGAPVGDRTLPDPAESDDGRWQEATRGARGAESEARAGKVPKCVPSDGMQKGAARTAQGAGRKAKGAEARQQVRDQTLPGATASDSVQVGHAGGEPGQPDESDIRDAREVYAQFRAGSYTGEWLADQLTRICSRSGCDPVQLMTAATAAVKAATAAELQHRPHPC